MATVILKNLKTRKEYPVSSEDWEAMKKRGHGNLFEVVKTIDHEQPQARPKKPVIIAPPEVQRLANSGQQAEKVTSSKEVTNKNAD